VLEARPFSTLNNRKINTNDKALLNLLTTEEKFSPHLSAIFD